MIDELVEAYSEPFAPYSAQALLLVSRAVRNSATVLLTGDGGDDVDVSVHDPAWLAKATKRGVLTDLIFRSSGDISPS